jgi:hypothetical protein
MAAESGTSKVRRVQGCTISMQAAVHPRHMPDGEEEEEAEELHL